MSINVNERNVSDCKYVEIFTHRVGSIGAPSRRTVFIIIIIIIVIGDSKSARPILMVVLSHHCHAETI
jgi:hypothetical protein